MAKELWPVFEEGQAELADVKGFDVLVVVWERREVPGLAPEFPDFNEIDRFELGRFFV